MYLSLADNWKHFTTWLLNLVPSQEIEDSLTLQNAFSCSLSGSCSCCSVAKSCPTLCDPMDCSLPGFSVHHYLSEFAETVSLYLLPSLCVCVYTCSVAQLCPTLFDPIDCSPLGSSVHGDSPGKNTGMGCHVFLQGIFPTQGFWYYYFFSNIWKIEVKFVLHKV